MPSTQVHMNFREQESLSMAIIGFSHFLRMNDFQVGLDASVEALKVARSGGLWSKVLLRHAFRPIFCGSFEDSARFDHLFDTYFRERMVQMMNQTVYENKKRTNPIATAVMLGFGERQTDNSEEAKNTSGGSKEEKLRATDFSKLSELDADELDDIALRLWKEMSLRLKKKQKFNARKGVIDVRKTIRSNAGNGFEFLDLIRKSRKPQKYKLILLLDVSGSMDKYSFYLLKFMWSLKKHFQSLEAFVFSTKLMRVTELLTRNDMQYALDQLRLNVKIWGSGTQIGSCLRAFNQKYARRIMQSRNICLVLSDGLDTGDADDLLDEVKELKRRTHKLIWLNPLKGSDDYAPVQRSMKNVVEHLDVFQASHSLNSLLELEKILVDV